MMNVKILLILNFFYALFIYSLEKEKFSKNSNKKCFSESIYSYTNKLKNQISAETALLKKHQLEELKSLNDFVSNIYKVKLKKYFGSNNVKNQIDIVENFNTLTKFENLNKLGDDLIKKIYKDQDQDEDYENFLNSIKKNVFSPKTLKSEINQISEVLTYNLQLTYLKFLEAKGEICLPSDFDYLIQVNTFPCELGEKTEAIVKQEPIIDNTIPITSEFDYIDIKDKNKDLTNIDNIDNYYYSNSFTSVKKQNIDEPPSYDFSTSSNSNGNTYVNSNYGSYSSSSSSSDKISTDFNTTPQSSEYSVNYYRKKLLDQSNSKNPKSKKVVLKRKNKISFFNDQSCVKQIDVMVNDMDYNYSVLDYIHCHERLTFYFIMYESLEFLSDKSSHYIFSDQNKNVFYSINKEESEEGVKFVHSLQFYGQQYSFMHTSKYSQHAHIFFTIDFISIYEMRFVFTIRFTATTELNFCKYFTVTNSDFSDSNGNLIIRFDKNLVKAINIFKNFSYSFYEEMSLIYKINHILHFNEQYNFANIQIKNFLSNDIIKINNILYDSEENIMDFKKNLKKKPDEMNVIESKYIYVRHLNLLELSEFSSSGCVYLNDKMKCLRCKKDMKLFENQCVEECPDNHVFSEERKTCVKCDNCGKCKIKDCEKCSEDKKFCLECKNGKVLYNTKCRNVCPNGTANEKNRGICKDCPSKCLICEDSKTCKTCITPYFLNDDKQCSLGDCTENKVKINGKCVACGDPNCRICDTDLNKCYNCHHDHYLFENKCHKKCPDGFFEDDKDHVCKECLPNCAQCLKAEICLKCKEGFYNFIISSCIKCSELGYNLTNDGKSCVPCKIKNCEKCILNNDNFCQVCKDKFLKTENGECVEKCPDGNYPDNISISGTCKKCSKNCILCENSNTCTKCEDNFKLEKGNCNLIVPKQSSDSSLKNLNHDECNSPKILPDLSEKDKCKEGQSSLRGKCYDKCPDGFYSDHNICQKCQKFCKSCTEDATKSIICLSCEEPFFLEDNTCKSKCPIGKFENKNINQCQKCNDENCQICLDADTCKRCNKESFLYKEKEIAVCLLNCPSGYFNEKETHKCMRCGENCKNCLDENTCLKCNYNFFLFKKSCVKECPENYGTFDHKCERCGEVDCKRCKNNDLNKCTKCSEGKFLSKGKCVPQEDCYIQKKYPDVKTNTCKNCEAKCKLCKDSSNCVFCHEEFDKHSNSTSNEYSKFMTHLNNKHNISQTIDIINRIPGVVCKNECPDGKVYDKLSRKCLCCADPLCTECTKKGEECIKCTNKVSLLDGNCYRNCPTTYFADLEVDKCRKCSIGCDRCSDRENCLRCLPGFFLNELNECKTHCPDNYFPDSDSRRCLECDDSCEICKDNQKKTCDFCAFNYFKHAHRCVNKNECPQGTFANYDLRECSQCDLSNCSECANKKICKVCNQDYKLSVETGLCLVNHKYITILDSVNLFSQYQYQNGNSFNNLTFSGDFRVTCESSKTLSLAFWSRIVTDVIKNETTLFEITHPFYEDYFKKDKNIEYSEKNYTNPGFYIAFKIMRKETDEQNHYLEDNYELKNINQKELVNSKDDFNKKDKSILNPSNSMINKIYQEKSKYSNFVEKIPYGNYTCRFEIIHLKNDFSINKKILDIDNCDFKLLKEYNFFYINFEILDTFNIKAHFSIFETLKNSNFSNIINISDPLYVKGELHIISHFSTIFINRNSDINPIFEMSNFKIFEIPLNNQDVINLYANKPLSCDVNCAQCDFETCLLCKDNKVYSDGHCKPSYISISSTLQVMERPKIYFLNELITKILHKSFSSDRFSFLTYFFLSKSHTYYKMDETLLFKIFYYNKVNLIELYLLEAGKLKIIINSKILKIFKIKILPETWHGINISIRKNSFRILMKNDQNDLLIDEFFEINDLMYLMRIVQYSQIYVYGGVTTKSSESDFSIYDTRFYFSNNFEELSDFSCGKNCIKCDVNLMCVLCEGGFIIAEGIKPKCIPEENLNPFFTFDRRSFYDNEHEMIEPQKNITSPSGTSSIWMKKQIPSKPGSFASILGFFDHITEKMYPILTQRISKDKTTTFTVDFREVESKEQLLPKQKPITYSTRKKKKEGSENNTNVKNSLGMIFAKNSTNHLSSIEKFSDYSNTTNQEDINDIPVGENFFQYSVNYENKSFEYIHAAINIHEVKENGKVDCTFALYDKSANVKFKTKLNIDKSLLSDFEIYIGDKNNSNINMAYGPIRFYNGNFIRDKKLYEDVLLKTKPVECNSACKECNYNTGVCTLCGNGKTNQYQCDLFLNGFSKAVNIPSQQQEQIISNSQNSLPIVKKIQVKNRKEIKKNPDFSTSLVEFFDFDINSKIFSVIGWFYIYKLPTVGKESIIFRLSNSDYGNFISENDASYEYDPGLNLITLKIRTISMKNSQFFFLVSDEVADKEIPVDLKTTERKWLFVHAMKNATNMIFEYYINYGNIFNFNNIIQTKLSYHPQNLQEITSLKLFGIDSITNNKTENFYGIAYNVYIVPNIVDTIDTIKDFIRKVDPTKPEVFIQCQKSCEICILDICIKCIPGFTLYSELCIKDEKGEYQILIHQENFRKEKNEFEINKNLINNNGFSIQFYIRRNYHPKSIVYENDSSFTKEQLIEKTEKNREILRFGNVKISLLNSIKDARLRINIDSPEFNQNKYKTTQDNLLYYSDDINDFEWFFVNIFINRTQLILKNSILENYDDFKILKIDHNGQVKDSFNKIFVDTLKNEITFQGLALVKTDIPIENSMLQRVRTDCPIDCTFCDTYPNNICLKCDYGKECHLNKSKERLCKYRSISIPSIYLQTRKFENKEQKISSPLTLNNSDKRKNTNEIPIKAIGINNNKEDNTQNYFKLSSFYQSLTHKILRFRSFTLHFIVSIDLEKSYDSIVKLVNYDTEDSNDGHKYDFLNLKFDTVEKSFKFSYSNKNIIRNSGDDSFSFNISPYKIRNNLNQYHFIAITYNDIQKLFSFVILNSNDNYIVDNLTVNGNLDFLGDNTSIIFGDGFKIANDIIPNSDNTNKGEAQTKFFEIEFLHEVALNTLEMINILQRKYNYIYFHGCKHMDMSNFKCEKCDENLQKINGVCHSKNLEALEIVKPNSNIHNYWSIPENIILNYDENKKVKSFTLQFMYLPIQIDQYLSGILKFSIYNPILKTYERDILEMLQNENSFIFLYRPFTDKNEIFPFFIDGIFKANESYAYLFINLSFDLDLKIILVYIFNYKSLEMNQYKFEYKKIWEEKEHQKDFNIIEKKKEEKFVYNFDFRNKTMTINSGTHNLITNESIYDYIKYKLSYFGFFINTELSQKEISKILPLRPSSCVCACNCVNYVCPHKCRFEEFWITYKFDRKKNKDRLFENFFSVIRENLEKTLFLDDSIFNNIRQYDDEIVDNYFKKISISYRMNMQKYVSLCNKYFSILYNIPLLRQYLDTYFSFAKYEDELEKGKNQGLYDFFKSDRTYEAMMQIEKALQVKDFRVKLDAFIEENKIVIAESGMEGLNLRYMFCLTNSKSAPKMKLNADFNDDILLTSILAFKFRFDRLRVYVGGNKFADTLFKKDLDYQPENSFIKIDFTEFVKMDVRYFFYIDTSNNFLKIILFINDMRKDFEIKFSHKSDYIGYFSSFYVNPVLEDLMINLGDVSISHHIEKMKERMNKNYNIKYCNDCSNCFLRYKKYLTKCLICPPGKVMYNNYCTYSNSWINSISNDVKEYVKKEIVHMEENNEIQNDLQKNLSKTNSIIKQENNKVIDKDILLITNKYQNSNKNMDMDNHSQIVNVHSEKIGPILTHDVNITNLSSIGESALIISQNVTTGVSYDNNKDRGKVSGTIR